MHQSVEFHLEKHDQVPTPQAAKKRMPRKWHQNYLIGNELVALLQKS